MPEEIQVILEREIMVCFVTQTTVWVTDPNDPDEIEEEVNKQIDLSKLNWILKAEPPTVGEEEEVWLTHSFPIIHVIKEKSQNG